MTLTIGSGALAFIDKDKTVTDGICYYKVVSPSLLFKFMKRKPGKNYIAGDFLFYNNTILLFVKRKKKYVFRYFPINEDTDIYKIIKAKREEIKICSKKLL